MNTATRAGLAIALLGIAACSPDGATGTQPIDPGLTVTPRIDTVAAGDTVRFSAFDSVPGNPGPLSWSVSDSRVAAVENQAGMSALVHALHQGVTTVTVTQGEHSASGALVVNAAKLAFTVQPTNTSAGTVLAPALVVAIEDASGAPITSATNAVTVALGTSPSGAILAGTTTVAAVNGIATFRDLSIQKAGSGYTLTASSSGLTEATSGPFAITPAAPAQLAFAVPPVATEYAPVITPPVQVVILDAFANPVLSATNSVTIATGANPSGGALSGTTTVSAVSGVATFADLGFDRPGNGYTLVASAPGLRGAASAPFTFVILTFASVTTGVGHSCAVTPAGVAYCWGSNYNGRLGNGTTTDSPTPVAVSGGLTFAAVSVGGVHTCGVTRASAAYCWGGNDSGALGNGTIANSPIPVAVVGGLAFSTVSAGYWHTCGITTAGAAYCWGTNDAGQLGNGTVASALATPAPVAVSGGFSFASLSAGYVHTCGVTIAGAAYCWGSNGFDELGSGSTIFFSATPVAVAGGLSFASLSAGQHHTCGVTTAGAAYCWGWNYSGQLGDGTTNNSPAPIAVSGGITFAAVTAGDFHTCGITPAGAAYCWGDNSLGELGDGTTNNRLTPVAVAGGRVFVTLSAGWTETCGLTRGGAVYCWGAYPGP